MDLKIKIRNMRSTFIALLFIVLHLRAFGDAAPKFPDNFQLYFYENGTPVTDVDSIVAFVNKDNGVIDTAALHYTREQYWNGTTLRKEADKYYIKSFQHIHSFTLVVYKGTSQFKSAKTNVYGHNYLFEFNLKNNALIEQSNMFRAHWADYTISLLITLLLEFLVIWILLRKWKLHQSYTRLAAVVIVLNLVTHPFLWYIDANFNISIWLLELAVILIEAKLLELVAGLHFSRACKASILLNIVSWWIGSLITYFILINMNLL